MLDFFKKPKRLLGLDISDMELRVIELSRRDNQYYIEYCASEKIARSSLQESERQQEQIEALRRLVEVSQIHNRQVAIAVSGPTVFTRVIELDATLSETDLQEQIELGLEAWVPFQLEEVLYDYEDLGINVADPSIRQLRLAVAKRARMDIERRWIELTGLQVAVIDVASIALERAERLFIKQGEIFSIINPDVLSQEASCWLLALGLASWGF